MSARTVALAAGLLLSIAASRTVSAAPVPAGAPVAVVENVDGVPCLGAGELSRLLDGVQYWHAETRKLVIRIQGHRLTLTDGVPIALLDDQTLRLDAPVRSRGGELQVPLSLLPLLPHDSTGVRLIVEPSGTRVRVAPAEGWVGAPRIANDGDATTVTLATQHPALARVISREREHFRVWLPGSASSGVPDSLPPESRLRALRRLPSAQGVLWEFALRPGTTGFRLTNPAGQGAVTLEFGAGPGLQRLAPEVPAGPRTLRMIVIDPGHGGDDAGVTVSGTLEKDLTLSLSRMLASELQHRLGARVLLTRDDDRNVDQPQRAEIANRARADLVLSLHFDGAARTHAHGATAWCPPLDAGGGDAAAQLLVPWRDVASRWAGASRSLADAVTASLETHGLGPARVRERLPLALVGVNAPGISLECATLTSADDLARVASPEGLHDLAGAIADGLIAWARHE